jgi:hypothetical protein
MPPQRERDRNQSNFNETRSRSPASFSAADPVMTYPEGLDGSRDAHWYRAEAVRLREWGNRTLRDPELRASYFSLAREYEGLAAILDGKDSRKRHF